MRKEFLISRQGKQFALYAGLLDLAHDAGLKSIITTLVQAPTEANNRVAICTATVQMENGRIFTGIGDAAPNNVAPAMQTCLLRMAETRAKSRALRDAVNIGVAAAEELGPDTGGEESDYVPTNRPRQQTPPRQEREADREDVIIAAANEQLKRDAEAFKVKATGMGFTGGLTLLCAHILNKSPNDVKRSDYGLCLKEATGAWNRAMAEIAELGAGK